MVADFDFRMDTATWGHSRQMGGGRSISAPTSWHGVFYEIEDTKGSDLQKKEGSSLLTMLSGVYGVAMAWPAKRLSSFVPSPIINWHF